MDSDGAWVAVALDEVERIDWRGSGITWRPVRRALGADIVGMAAFTAERPEEVVVEPHNEVEDGRGHQEIYVVIRGKARFVIDGAEVDAPAGTLLRVDPQADREAIAIEVDTAVLALGGESTFEASASEWIERARPHIRANPSRAREIIEDLRRELPVTAPAMSAKRSWRSARAMSQGARAIVAQLIDDLPQRREVLEHDPDLRAILPG